ncbi:MAG: hypothetical protein J5779_02815 [Clostridia bacterium]|nr:hypothetical protein [Clostridia bacterium]
MIKFGTSGFRAIMGENFTKENVLKIGYALSEYFKNEKTKKPTVVIGYDNRFMSDMFAKWMTEVLASKKIKVTLYSKSVPSPLISFMTKDFDLGVMITSSHNPYYYNGVKIFKKPAKEVDDEFTSKIEVWANENINIQTKSFDEYLKTGEITLTDNIQEYCNHILSFIDVNKTKKLKFKILYNAMNGNCTECFEYIFNKMKIKYEGMNTEVDPYFRHMLPSPYKKNLTDQMEKLKKEKFDFGVALDGDSDRISILDSKGNFIDGNFILPVLYYYFKKYKNYQGGLVKNTALSNLSFKLAKYFGEECYNAKTGFKNIGKILDNTSAFLGGESNGIAFKEHVKSKDGIVATALLIDMMAESGKTIDEVLKEIQNLVKFKSKVVEYAYPITAKQKQEIMKLLSVKKKSPNLDKIVNINFDGEYRINFENDYWATIRFSGTENVVRIFAEQENLKNCEEVVLSLEKFIGVSVRQ